MKRNMMLMLVSVIMASMALSQERKEVSLTIYNNNLGLVSEVRVLKLKSGQNEVRLTEIPSQIDPTSVHFVSQTSPDKVTILEQNYQYDLVSAAKLMERYIDSKIKIYSTSGKVYEGQLLASDGGNIVLNTGSGIVTLRLTDNLQNIEYPSLPQGLMTKPTLVWLLDNQGAASQNCQVSYLTGGLSWHAEYVALLADDEKSLELGAWVSIENSSGTAYENARLKLVAGDVNRAREPRSRYSMAKADMMAAAPQFEEKSFFEYHMYTLQRKATVAANETKQIALFPNAGVPCKKVYTYDGANSGKNVSVELEFRNDKASGLGLALPAGKVRVYKSDNDKSRQFIGEDMIGHTPKDEKVRVVMGQAFDIVGERTAKEYKRISDRSQEQTVEIKLRNHKNEGVEVAVVEHLYGDWEIRSKSHDFKRRDANTAEFLLKVPKDGEVTLSYTVRYKW